MLRRGRHCASLLDGAYRYGSDARRQSTRPDADRRRFGRFGFPVGGRSTILSAERNRVARGMTMRRILATLSLLALFSPADARSDAPAETAIRSALVKWTSDFNSGNEREVCDLFAADLRYDYRGHAERGFADICSLLQRSLRDRTRTYSYTLRIKEILVSGELAVVRLVWTLKATPVGTTAATVSEEPGMDVFRRQADGRWRIVRYIAYEN